MDIASGPWSGLVAEQGLAAGYAYGIEAGLEDNCGASGPETLNIKFATPYVDKATMRRWLRAGATPGCRSRLRVQEFCRLGVIFVRSPGHGDDFVPAEGYGRGLEDTLYAGGASCLGMCFKPRGGPRCPRCRKPPNHDRCELRPVFHKRLNLWTDLVRAHAHEGKAAGSGVIEDGVGRE